jgi:ribosomal protein S18 acetylase RimI-like enzyme
VSLQPATEEDVADLLTLRTAVNQRLIEQFGNGYWIWAVTEKGARFQMKMSSVFIARRGGQPIATLALSTRKPWAIVESVKKCFTACKRPLYLTGMAVHPAVQRQGVGRECIGEVRRIAGAWPGDAIRLDAYDTAAGAGEFYRKCGFTEIGRATYRGAPLIYYELLL